MRLIVLELCMGVAAVMFVTMLGTLAMHRARRRASDLAARPAPSEYLWAVIPWALIAACALPAVRIAVAGD
ncbi:MAG: hypothetical protein WDO72_05880 [Pseudomonadota bacterium]